MNTFGNYPAKYLQYNQQLSKQLSLVMVIEDIPYVFSISDTFQMVRYGDPGLVYGAPGLVYGGLRKIGGPNGVGGVKSYIMLDSLIIQQRIEPEQGKGNVGTITMTLIDVNGEVSYMIAPGNLVDEIMASKQVTIYLGFQQTSFPEDFLIIYRGYITSLDCPPGMVRFQISDGTMKSRQPIFSTPTTTTTTPIDSSQTNIPVLSTGGFYQQILGPDGNYSSTVHTYIVIDSETMEYSSSGITGPTSFTVTRGVLGTPAVAHDAGTAVTNGIQFGQESEGGGINFIVLTLQLLLSGWDGPCETNVGLLSLGFVDLGTVSNAMVLLTQDANLDIGLTVGDYFTVTGAIDPANDVTGRITGFGNLNGFTKIILTDQTFSQEPLTTGVASFRSQYDVLPISAGSKCRMRDVDVQTFQYILKSYFTSSIYQVAIYFDSPVFAKDIVASELMLPMGCYQISRYGRISMSVAKPPLPGIGKLVQVDYTNVIDPDKIHVTRATNNRNFYNVVSYEYDYSVANQSFSSVQYFVDTGSLNAFQQQLALPIQSKGLKTILGGSSIASIRGQALLTRYKSIALLIELTVNWSVGSLLEVSDIVLLVDNGTLFIMNFNTGVRNLGSQLFEVISRSFDIKSGNVKLQLLSGLGFSVNSRFGLISPSSQLNISSTGTLLRLIPSYGQTQILSEIAKWVPFLGLPIVVHSPDYSVIGTSTLVSVSATDSSALVISPDLGFTPDAGYILEIANYPTSTDKNENSQYKALYAYLTPSVPIVTGISDTQFTVASGDIGKFFVGNLMIVRRKDWFVFSQEVTISTVDTGTNTVTVDPALKNQSTGGGSITPNSNYLAEGLGFADGTGYYRYD